MSRRTLLTPQLVAKLVARIADGSPLVKAAKSVGIHRDTLFSWLGRFPDFSDAVRNARAIAEAVEVTEAMRLSAALQLDFAKRRGQLHQGVRDGFAAGATPKETALKLGISRATEWRYRDNLRLTHVRARRVMLEQADAELLTMRRVVVAYAEGFRAAGDAECRWAENLGLLAARGNNQHRAKRKPTGRRDTRAAIEVRP